MTLYLNMKVPRMLNYITLIFLLGTLSFQAKAQEKTIKGKVYDDHGNVLSWVNIGIRNMDVGTVSKEDGSFQLLIPDSLKDKSLTFSFVGFEENVIPVKKLNPSMNMEVVLHEKTTELQEVTITNKELKPKTLGTKLYAPLLWFNLTVREQEGYLEPAKLIKIKEPAKLLNANIRVAGNKKSKDSITFRLNIYKIEDGLPGDRLIEKNIIKTFPLSTKLLTFDLKDEDIILNEDCAIAFEYIPKNTENPIPLYSFRAVLGSTDAFIRSFSTGKWYPIDTGSLSLFLEVLQ